MHMYSRVFIAQFNNLSTEFHKTVHDTVIIHKEVIWNHFLRFGHIY